MTDFKSLCVELLAHAERAQSVAAQNLWLGDEDEGLFARARAALAEPKPPCRYIYNPSQIAECGGPCEQGPKHCDCGELWMVEPEPAAPEGREPGSVAERPTVMQLIELSYEIEAAGLGQIDFARAVLARWGNCKGSLDSSPTSSSPLPPNLKTMSELSPAAQAVLQAACNQRGLFNEEIAQRRHSIAAAIRAAVDQVVPLHICGTNATRAQTRLGIRHKLLTIAAELEGHV